MNTLDKAQDLLDHLTIGVALVDAKHLILYCNKYFRDCAKQSESAGIEGRDFYEVLDNPQIVDGCYAPFHFALSEEGSVFRSVLARPRIRNGVEQTFELLIQLQVSSNHEKVFRIELKDISEVSRNEKRLQSLKTLGKRLSFITDVGAHSMNEQREELKKIIREQMDGGVLNYSIFEIRIIKESYNKGGKEQKSKELVHFTSFGLSTVAQNRVLHVGANGNGITGYVASSGESYICNDTKNDPLYVTGAIAAKSSLTVPLVYNNKVIGTCNVESEIPNNFSSQDQLFLELYAKDVAFALHLLDYTSSIKKEDIHTYAQHFCSLRNSLSNCILKLMYEKDTNVSQPLSAKEEKDKEKEEQACFSLLDKTTRLFKEVQKTILPHQEEEDQEDPFKEARITSFEDKHPNLAQDTKIEWPILKQFLRYKKILSIAPSPILEDTYLKWLDPLVEQIDVVTSTSQALWLLKRQKYDIVLTELFPDGRYFEPITMEVAHNFAANANGRTVFDIHYGEEYWPEVEGNQQDKETRDRIKEEIKNGKRDAFFFIKDLIKDLSDLQLGALPLFFIIPYAEYDPTHTVPAITAFLKNINMKWVYFPFVAPANEDSELIVKFFKKMKLTYSKNIPEEYTKLKQKR